MNLGGPAIAVAVLADRLRRDGWDATIVTGTVGAGETDHSDAARSRGVPVIVVPDLGPAISPLADLRALLALVRILRRIRPTVVHTHTAKAGMLGRVAALAVLPRPRIVHTYHGHVLTGYFSPPVAFAYRA